MCALNLWRSDSLWKPTRLAAIKKNTRTIWDEVGECWLYEDMQYKSSNTAKESTERVSKRACEVAEKVKKQKKTKVENGDASAVSPAQDKEEVEKPLSSAMVKTADGSIAWFTKNMEKLDELLQECGPEGERAPFTEYMPSYILTSMAASKAKVGAHIEALGMFKEWEKATASSARNMKMTTKELKV